MLVCITGEIGSGKSTALNIIKANGYATFSMDEYVHHIYKHNQIGYRLIKQHFGKEYVDKTEVNRKKLGKLVFASPNDFKKLNKLMIPLIQQQLEKLSRKASLLFVELGILIHQEKSFSKYFNKIIYIKAKKELIYKNLRKKIPYLTKLPTMFVGKLNYSTKTKQKSKYIVVGNHQNLKNFTTNILKILQSF
jgi:dephospho-CoA kinase